MENIKPEDILEKHLKNTHNMPGGNGCILTAMREYAQIACSTLSEEIRVKDSRIESVILCAKDLLNRTDYLQGNLIEKSVKDLHESISQYELLTPPTNT